ncbi:hypothetical protein R6242_16205 [Iodobacter sp. CM08]|uniref:hypothetical protein n=1 Tax=Iodobacter sp. CM08 TaxID=3085902 RepID=UPI0029815839|nr:hypothetical protein [Iodobacter sp. CM08]MDW5418110.1 hypothetical protein [Iodobacter sp. CM08]
MTFERIDNLVTMEGFHFQAWDDRYSKGVWAALGTSELEIVTVYDLSSAGDNDMSPAMDYVFSAGWLPYVTGRTLIEAMQKLEERLALLPTDQLCRNSDWAALVRQAIEALRNAESASSTYGDLQTQIPDDLPQTFDAARAVMQPVGKERGRIR